MQLSPFTCSRRDCQRSAHLLDLWAKDKANLRSCNAGIFDVAAVILALVEFQHHEDQPEGNRPNKALIVSANRLSQSVVYVCHHVCQTPVQRGLSQTTHIPHAQNTSLDKQLQFCPGLCITSLPEVEGQQATTEQMQPKKNNACDASAVFALINHD